LPSGRCEVWLGGVLIFNNLGILLLGLGHSAQFCCETRPLAAVLERQENESFTLQEKDTSIQEQPEDTQEILQPAPEKLSNLGLESKTAVFPGCHEGINILHQDTQLLSLCGCSYVASHPEPAGRWWAMSQHSFLFRNEHGTLSLAEGKTKRREYNCLLYL